MNFTIDTGIPSIYENLFFIYYATKACIMHYVRYLKNIGKKPFFLIYIK